jgi:HK97 family phage major capsid protein
MKTLKELRQQRALKATRGKAALSELKTLQAKAELTADEATKVAALETEITALEDEVPTLDAQIVSLETEQRRELAFAPRTAHQAARTFEPNPELTGGFKAITHFAQAVMAAQTGTLGGLGLEAAASNYMQNQGAAGEGYLVPPQYSQEVAEIAFNEPDLFGMANPEPTNSNTFLKPKDETTPWGASGVQAVWRAEAAQMTASKLALTGEISQLHELYAFCAASNEVLSDASMLQNRLTTQAGRAIAWTASEAVMWGSGAGQPTGFMKAPCLVTVAKEAGQADTTIVVLNLGKMLSRVLRVGGKPLWFANPDIIPQLIGLTIGNMPVWVPMNQGIQANPFDGYLLGYPVIFTEHAQTLGVTGDLVCANLAGYYAAVKAGGVEFASSIHLYFDQNLTAFRWTFRINGQPILSKAVQPAKGATTKSHFVALASRP